MYKSYKEIELLVEKFMNATLPKEQWTHEAHLTVGLWLISHYKLAEAVCLIRSGVVWYNKSIGNENTAEKGYHETITLFWAKVIYYYITEVKTKGALEEILDEFLQSPYSKRDYILEFYSKNLLMSSYARAFWTEPDLKPFVF